MSAEFPVEKFMQAQSNKLGQTKGKFNAASNYASQIGGTCLRQMVYSRTRAAEAAPLTDESMANILEGNDQELAVIRWLQDMGYNLIRSQEAFAIEAALIHGKIDGVIILRDGGVDVGKWPAEIKSVQTDAFERINTMDDIRLSDNSWQRKWYAQLQLAINHTKDTRGFGPFGVLLLKDKTKKRVKPISFYFDQAEIDRCIANGIEVNRHVAAKTLPDRVSYASGACKWCDYRHICNPEEIFKAGKNIQDADFISKLREWNELEESSSRCKKLWEYIKETLRGVEFATAGEFQVEGNATKTGWKVNVTKVFPTSINQLVAAVKTVPAEDMLPTSTPEEHIDELHKAAETLKKELNEPLTDQERSIVAYYHIKSLIESATTKDQAKSAAQPARAAKEKGELTIEQMAMLSEQYTAKLKELAKPKGEK